MAKILIIDERLDWWTDLKPDLEARHVFKTWSVDSDIVDYLKRMISTLKKFAQTDSTILITGETGTGKSSLSGAVHYNSHRRNKPFIKINCANLPETLLESELFGHEKGAFTGANKTRVGRLEQAKDGTVFLDEIGEMSAALQAKLLRVLEEKSFERVGGNRTITSDVRIIAATNRKPEDQVSEGSFREELYYRLNVLRIHILPLRVWQPSSKPGPCSRSSCERRWLFVHSNGKIG